VLSTYHRSDGVKNTESNEVQQSKEAEMPTRKRDESDHSKITSSFRHTVKPGISSPIYLQMVPGATCLLYRSDDNDPERRLRLFADDDGIICFHVRPTLEA
jgi:hypothetical protein